MPGPQDLGFIPQGPQPAPLPPDGGQAFQPWDAIPDNRSLTQYDTVEAAKGNAAHVWAQVPPVDLVALFNPKDAPVAGMFSSAHPSSLSPGQFPLIQNLRFDDGTFSGRYPTVDRAATGLPSGTNIGRGLWCGNLNGTQVIVAAVYDGSKVGLYASTDGIAFSMVSTDTATNKAYGETRLTDTGQPVSFGVVTDPVSGTDYLVVQNGVDDPRVYGTQAVNGEYVRIHQAIAAPTSLNGYSPTIGAPCHADLTTGVSVASTGTTFSGLAYASIFSSQPQFVGMIIGNDTAGDTGTITFASVDWSGATQFCMAWATNQPTSLGWLLQRYKVEIFDTVGGWQTAYDPTSGSNPYNWYEPTSNGSATAFQYVTLFTIDVSALTRASITKIRLTAMDTAAWATPFNVWMLAVFGGTATGNWPASDQTTANNGGASYLCSFANSGSRAESAGVVLSPSVGGNLPLWTTLGAQSFAGNPGSYGGLNLPVNTKVGFSVTVPFVNPSTSDRDAGVDTLNVYRLDDGATDYLFARSVSLATWSGTAWSFDNTGGSGVYSAADTSGAQGLTVNRIAPDAYAQTLPKGTAMSTANGRAFVGSASSVWISEYGQPWRFRPYLAWSDGQPVERSATKVILPGEACSAFAVAAASALASSTIFVWTDRNVYSFSGFDGYSLSRPTTLAAIGCGAARSVQVYKDVIFFLDTQGQIRRFTYGSAANGAWELMPPITRRVVDDRTTGIPSTRLAWCASAVFADRYYLANTPSGGTDNTRVLVWDEYVRGFCEDTCTTEVALATASLGGKRLLLAQGSNGHVYTHEDPASSTLVTMTLTFPELHTQLWHPVFYGRLGLVMDVQAGQTATITRTLKPNRSDTTVIDLATNATSQVWRWDHRSGAPDGAPGGQTGVSCQISMTCAMTPGTRLYSAVLERMLAAPGADA